ncbi:MAG: MG2 domain-containing protein [Verrucomicrobia bacterium]|nr:MG2 domain-containing protein [Verrucomicrobiota bacterium]
MPRLYFPSADTEQLSEGQRVFELLSVNVPEVVVRARLLDRHTLVHALRGYRSYFRTDFWREEAYEPYRAVDFNVLPGRALSNRTLALPAGRDETTRSVIAWDDLLGERRPGAVFLEAAATSAGSPGQRPGTQALVQLTDLGLFWKRTGSNVWVWAYSYHTAQPLPGTTLRLVTDDNEVLAEAVAGPEGGASFGLAPNAVWLLAEHGNDLRAAELRRHELYVEASEIPRRYEWSGPEPTRQVLLFSERPVYRPGETVHLKAIVRDREGEALAMPADLTGHFTVRDARDRKFHEADAAFSALGSLAGRRGAAGAGTGTYRAALRLGTNEVHTHYFQVQDYQPDAFELTLPVPAAFAAGEGFACPVRAQYRFGDEVSRGTVRWTLRAEDEGFAPAGFEAFAFCSQVWVSGSPYRSESWTAEGQADYVRGTPLVVGPPVPLNAKAPQPRAVEVRVELTDLNQQTLARGARSVLHSSAFYLGVRVAAGLPQAERPWPVEIIAVDPAGQPRAESIPVRVRLERIEWRTVRQQGAGGSLNYRSEPEYVRVSEQDAITQVPVWTGRRWEVPADAPPAATLTAPAAGSYLLEVRARDAADREVVTALVVYVSGAGMTAWDYRNPAVLDLVPDRTNYGVGDTAQLLVRAPFSGTAVVTVERDRVMRSFLTRLNGNAPSVAVPLRVEDAPAVYVSVMLLRG